MNWNSYDFADLLLESLEQFSTIEYQVILVDNSESIKKIDRRNLLQILIGRNIGHGAGLNLGVVKANEFFPTHQYLMFLDVDCHILTHRWEVPFLMRMKNHSVVSAPGVPSKPLRPACLFMKKKLGSYDWQATPNYKGNRPTPEGLDVCVPAYHKMVSDNHKIDFMGSIKPSRYETINGEEWTLDNTPVVYHHWHGSHLAQRQVDFPGHDLQIDKKKMFEKISWRLP